MSATVSYRGWLIDFDPPPIPIRNCDWHFHHEDFDGVEAPDDRFGHAASLEAAKDEIDERECGPIHPAIDNLRRCQRQLDADGCEVGVSRQAVDETLAIVAALMEAANIGREAVKSEIDLLLECSCLLTDDLEPIEETLNPEAREVIDELRANLTTIEAAVAFAEGR